MASLSRRAFIQTAAEGLAVAGGLAANVATLRANPLGLPIGSQTWPHRATIKAGNFPALLATLKAIGIDAIELCSPIGYPDFSGLTDGKQVRTIIADHGLACTSAHFTMRELRERQADSLAWAAAAGITQIITASLGAGNTPALEEVKRAADEYNRIAAVSAMAGLQQGLHNEGFEVSMVGGERTYEVLLRLLDPKLVKFQFQMSTISQGFHAHEYFTRYPGRFFSMHVQDVDVTAGVQTAVGKGSVDWVKTFQAARLGGVQNYFVEQTMELTRASVAALKAMKV
jgi:sugar phosphate isomerase/epimerase